MGPPQVGQPATRKGQETKARILRAAADLILEHGVTGTGLEDVRRVAGVSGSQLTHYFRDKQTLVKEVIAWQAASTIQLHRSPELGELDTFEALREWARLNIEAQEARGFRGGCTFGSLAGQLVESDPNVRADLARGFDEWITLFREGLTRMRNRGDLRPEADPNALAYTLMSALQGGMLLSQTLRQAQPLQASLSSALDQVESFAAFGRNEEQKLP